MFAIASIDLVGQRKRSVAVPDVPILVVVHAGQGLCSHLSPVRAHERG